VSAVDGLRIATSDRAAVLTLDRPERNELDGALLDVLRTALADADADPAVDVIVLTGAGAHFCGGLDLAQISDPERGPALAARVFTDWRIWSPLSKPVIGAVNGPVERGGLELALHCDLLLASERATFADTHARLGFAPALGLTALLAHAVGPAWAARMSLTGDAVDAATAARIGLVTEVVPHDGLLAAALGVAAAISGNVQDAVRTVLGTYRAAATGQIRDALAIERDSLRRTLEATPPGPERDAVLDVVRATGDDGGAPGGAGTPPS
jgi:enoyl-CoA hydratase/carnithine racemase